MNRIPQITEGLGTKVTQPADAIPPVASVPATRLLGDVAASATCDVAEEVPLVIRYNGFSHAVMMGTPADLEDFAAGFSLTDGVAADVAALRAIRLSPSAESVAIDIDLDAPTTHRLLARRRVSTRVAHASCGVCGIEELAEVMRESALRPVPSSPPVPLAALRRALAELGDQQMLNRRTGAMHAAAWAAADGTIRLVREDVGRHNALDKLIGACLRGGVPRDDGGFCVVTSRCSFEMVQKAVIARMPVLAAISAPTALAIRHARHANLTLVAFARADGQTIYTGGERIAITQTGTPV